MKIKLFRDFTHVTEDADEKPASKEYLDGQKELSNKIAILNAKIGDAIKDPKADPKEINKAKLMLKIAKLEKELEDLKWRLSEFDKKKD